MNLLAAHAIVKRRPEPGCADADTEHVDLPSVYGLYPISRDLLNDDNAPDLPECVAELALLWRLE